MTPRIGFVSHHAAQSRHSLSTLLLRLFMICSISMMSACGDNESAATPTAVTALVAPTETPTMFATTAPTLASLPTFTPIPTAAPGVLSVDAAQDLGAVSPYLFGSGYGPWVALRPEVMPLAEAAGVSVIRYPGGEWGDSNDLTPLQIDQFVDLARRLGAEPYIHVRLPESTPEKAAEMVRYANIEKGYAIKFWSIGNEPSLYQGRDDRAEWDAAHFNTEWRKFATAMKAVDPAILLLGPETHQFTGDPGYDPKDKAGADWMVEFLKANGDMVDMVTFHRYPFPNNAERTAATIDELRANPPQWDEIIRRLHALIREHTGRDLPVGVTEVNSHWSRAINGEATPDSHFSAIWLADVLGRLMRQKVEMVNQFLLVSGQDQNGFGLLDRYAPRPAYFVYPMYKMFGRSLVYANSDDPLVSVYAARRDDGRLTLMVINLGDETVTKPLRLEGFSPAGLAEVWRFDTEHQAEQIARQVIADNAQLTLPPQSMTLYVLSEAK